MAGEKTVLVSSSAMDASEVEMPGGQTIMSDVDGEFVAG